MWHLDIESGPSNANHGHYRLVLCTSFTVQYRRQNQLTVTFHQFCPTNTSRFAVMTMMSLLMYELLEYPGFVYVVNFLCFEVWLSMLDLVVLILAILGTILLTNFHWYWFMEIMFSNLFLCNGITTNLCTCHDCTVVIMFAKVFGNIFFLNWMWTNGNFPKISNEILTKMWEFSFKKI